MTHKVHTLRRENSVEDAINLMAMEDIGAIPIIDDDSHVVGILTDRDIVVRCFYNKHPLVTTVEEYMTTNVCTLYEDEEVGTIVSTMSQLQIKRIPIVDKDNKLAGIISLGDLATNTQTDAKSAEALRNISMPNSSDFGSNPNYDNKVDNFPL
ncbi:CBS domain-containing protein [Mycoplasmatota bacterium WC44]